MLPLNDVEEYKQCPLPPQMSVLICILIDLLSNLSKVFFSDWYNLSDLESIQILKVSHIINTHNVILIYIFNL